MNKLILVLLLIASLFTVQFDNSVQAQTTSPTPDGRPLDAYGTTTETCNCTCPAPGTLTYTCTLTRPTDTRTCDQACTDEAPMYCTSAQTTASP